MRDFLATVLICLAVYSGYAYFTRNIHVSQQSKEARATVIEKHEEKTYTYIRFTYKIDGRDYTKSSRLPPKAAIKEGETITIRYLPEKPEEPILNFNPESLNAQLYYFFIAASIFMLLKFTGLLAASTRPNYE